MLTYTKWFKLFGSLFLAIGLFASVSTNAYAWHGGGGRGGGGWHGGGVWHHGGGGWHGGGVWHRGGGWGHAGWRGGGGYGGWGGRGIFIGPGLGYGAAYYGGARCGWVVAHRNLNGRWIPAHRACW